MPTERENALEELKLYCDAENIPVIEDEELGTILDGNLLVSTWAAGVSLNASRYVYPTVSNGHKYRIVNPGITGTTEPAWSVFEGAQIIDNLVVFEEAGPLLAGVYDLQAAIRRAWEIKAGRASKFMATGGANMSVIYDHCQKMIDRYQSAYVG